MSLKKGNYPYPAKNVFLVLGGPCENYFSKHFLSLSSEMTQSQLFKNVDILNKITTFIAVAENKQLVKDYAADIMPEWWETYNIVSKEELLSWDKSVEYIKLEDGIKWLVRLTSNLNSIVLEGVDLDILSIKNIVDSNIEKGVFQSAIPLEMFKQTIIDMDAVSNGIEEERFIFDTKSNDIYDYIDNLFLSLTPEHQEKILKNSKK